MSISNKIYLEEASELLEKMEADIVSLEVCMDSRDVVQEIFRNMHTLKGNSSMFGLVNIVEFVHALETIYESVLNDKLEINSSILSISLTAIDHVKLMIEDPELSDANLKVNNEKLSLALTNILKEKSTSSEPVLDQVKKTYYVSFTPGRELLHNGTNPFFLLLELKNLGNSIIIPHQEEQDDLDKIDFTSCYASWEIIISTDKSINDIRDVFVFVEDESDIIIKKISDYNLVKIPKFYKTIKSEVKALTAQTIDIKWLKKITKDIIEQQGKLSTDNDNQKQHVVTDKSNQQEEATNVVSPFSTSTPAVHNDISSTKKNKKMISSVRVASDKLDNLLNIVSELVTTQASLSLFSENHYYAELETISENVEKLSRQLRDVAFGMTLIPIKGIIGRFRRMIFDTSKSLGKDVKFEVIGDDTELDKSIIEQITDPLMHIMRNSLDHGLELPEDRAKAGKPQAGTITFKSYYSGANVHIEISDDGRGLNKEAIQNKAIQKGIIDENVSLSDSEIYELIFSPGFSTAQKVTDVSGRGVGLDVVGKNISALRGDVKVKSVEGKGTTITIILPLTLSVIDGLLVKIENDFFVIPLSVIEKCNEIKYEKLLDTFNNTIIIDGEQIPFINLRDEFTRYASNPPEYAAMVIIKNEEFSLAICIDEIIGEYQAVLKPVGKHYQNQEFVSGATILGDGTIALVLDTNKLLEIKAKINQQMVI